MEKNDVNCEAAAGYYFIMTAKHCHYSEIK
jgi:hypothetical protein